MIDPVSAIDLANRLSPDPDLRVRREHREGLTHLAERYGSTLQEVVDTVLSQAHWIPADRLQRELLVRRIVDTGHQQMLAAATPPDTVWDHINEGATRG